MWLRIEVSDWPSGLPMCDLLPVLTINKVIKTFTDLEYEIFADKNYDLESLVPSSGLEFFFFLYIDKPLLLLLTPIFTFYIISQLECIGFKKNYQTGNALEK